MGTAVDPEIERWTATVLWEACRRELQVAKLREAISNGADLRLASQIAVDQRIGPLLWRALGKVDAWAQLGDAREGLEALAKVSRFQALILLPRAVEAALMPLVQGGLEPVVLKGPALAQRYPEPGLRPMEDIDVLLPVNQHTRALKLLTNAGWRVVKSARRDGYDTVLAHHEIPSLALELHYALEAPYERLTSLDPLKLWERRIPMDCLGTPAFSLPLPEELVTLAAHAGKPFHGFSRLIWVADLAMVTGYAYESGQDVDWERTRAVAQAGRCTTVVTAALSLAQRVGVSAPSDLFPLPRSRWRANALRRLLDVSWPFHVRAPGSVHLSCALTDGWWRRVRILAGSPHSMTPGRSVLWWVSAPPSVLSRWWRSLRDNDLTSAG